MNMDLLARCEAKYKLANRKKETPMLIRVETPALVTRRFKRKYPKDVKKNYFQRKEKCGAFRIIWYWSDCVVIGIKRKRLGNRDFREIQRERWSNQFDRQHRDTMKELNEWTVDSSLSEYE